MISWDFTESRTPHPPIAAADSSIKAFAAVGPVGGADEQADKSISNARTIATIKHLHVLRAAYGRMARSASAIARSLKD
jgi:hypothetical protein